MLVQLANVVRVDISEFAAVPTDGEAEVINAFLDRAITNSSGYAGADAEILAHWSDRLASSSRMSMATTAIATATDATARETSPTTMGQLGE
jgi:hypothetical protein